MKAVEYRDVNDYKIIEIEEPSVNSLLNVKVRTEYCGICGSDIHKLLYEKPNSDYVKTSILGHEITGEIVEVSNNVKELKIGDKVVVEPLLYCNECEECKKGHIQFCKNLKSLGKDIQGGFAEYVIANEKQLHKIGVNTDLKLATLSDPYSVAIHTRNLINNHEQCKIAIIGDGIIGISVAELMRKRNIVTVFGKHQNRESILKKIDVKYKSVNDINNYYDYFDVVIEAVGGRQAKTLSEAIKLCRKKGKIIVTGVYDTNFKFDISLREAFYKELQIIGCNSFENNNGKSDFTTALEFLENESLIANDLISKTYDICDFDQAIEYIKDRSNNNCIKVMIKL
ncbi:MAG: alcohol dehydrogenase catalytic domain-containing protein [Clostridia bacterium]|nr:alcohol dehydrogenase catalytic domain-containing protein [Clostridia bacterium]